MKFILHIGRKLICKLLEVREREHSQSDKSYDRNYCQNVADEHKSCKAAAADFSVTDRVHNSEDEADYGESIKNGEPDVTPCAYGAVLFGNSADFGFFE